MLRRCVAGAIDTPATVFRNERAIETASAFPIGSRFQKADTFSNLNPRAGAGRDREFASQIDVDGRFLQAWAVERMTISPTSTSAG